MFLGISRLDECMQDDKYGCDSISQYRIQSKVFLFFRLTVLLYLDHVSKADMIQTSTGVTKSEWWGQRAVSVLFYAVVGWCASPLYSDLMELLGQALVRHKKSHAGIFSWDLLSHPCNS